jgi:NAD(P)H-quinone oxidoreductase subunit 5
MRPFFKPETTVMQTSLAWLVLLGPLTLAGTGVLLLVRGRRAARDPGRAGSLPAAAMLVIASLAAAAVAQYGPQRTGLVGGAGVGFSVWLDALSVTMLLVSFIGLIVVRYSRHYLAGDPGQPRFVRLPCLALAAVLLLIVAGNLLQFTLAWIATSLALHWLLLFYADRPVARLAARKKFIASRLGDLCLGGAMLLLYRSFGSLDYADLVRDAGASSLAACLLAAAAMLKSAQFPLHGWLPEVMETPTPVSALLHAGIINAGGFLVLRFAGLISASGPAMDLLVLVGGFTALFGSVVMLTQASVKVALAYSTIAQMGFMLLQCGLGAFSAAALHIIAHSLYKAHAFLSSGSVIDLQRAAWTPSPGGQPHSARMIVSLLAVICSAVAVAAVLGVTLEDRPGHLALGTIMTLGLSQLVANSIDERPSSFVIGITAARAAGVAGVWFALQWVAEQLFAGALPPLGAPAGPFELAVIGLVVLSFAALALFQGMLPHRAAEWHALYFLISNGFYVNTFVTRAMLRLWPALADNGRANPAFNVNPGVRT